eukprot:354157-Chlamydomonas_euryale.AAC.6
MCNADPCLLAPWIARSGTLHSMPKYEGGAAADGGADGGGRPLPVPDMHTLMCIAAPCVLSCDAHETPPFGKFPPMGQCVVVRAWTWNVQQLLM